MKGSLWVGGRQVRQIDPNTGKQLKELVQKLTKPMGHDRCYRNYITERYFINSKTGGADFLDLAACASTAWTRKPASSSTREVPGK